MMAPVNYWGSGSRHVYAVSTIPIHIIHSSITDECKLGHFTGITQTKYDGTDIVWDHHTVEPYR